MRKSYGKLRVKQKIGRPLEIDIPEWAFMETLHANKGRENKKTAKMPRWVAEQVIYDYEQDRVSKQPKSKKRKKSKDIVMQKINDEALVCKRVPMTPELRRKRKTSGEWDTVDEFFGYIEW